MIPEVGKTCILYSGCSESNRKFSSDGFLHVRVSHASQRPVSNWLAVINPSLALIIIGQSVVHKITTIIIFVHKIIVMIDDIFECEALYQLINFKGF